MKYSKVAISVPTELLIQVDRLVKEHRFPSRSFAIQKSIEDKLNQMNKTSLVHACNQLDSKEEQALAEETKEDYKEWPKY